MQKQNYILTVLHIFALFRQISKRVCSQSLFHYLVYTQICNCRLKVAIFMELYGRQKSNSRFEESEELKLSGKELKFSPGKFPPIKLSPGKFPPPRKFPAQKIPPWNIPTHFINCPSSLFLHLIFRPQMGGDCTCTSSHLRKNSNNQRKLTMSSDRFPS